MGRSQKWPDLRSPMSKIRDIRFVGTGDLIIFRKFHNFPWNIVAVARLESYFVVGSLDLTWWPDLTWHWVEIFTKVAEKMGGKVGENPAALRAAVISLSSGGVQTPPPPAGRGLIPGPDQVPHFRHRAGMCLGPGFRQIAMSAMQSSAGLGSVSIIQPVHHRNMDRKMH